MANEDYAGGTPVNKPASGTYGEKADLSRLQKSLPQTSAGPQPAGAQPMPAINPQPISPQPAAQGRPTTGAAPPLGVPSVLLSPTTQPDRPVNTPLSSPSPTAVVNPMQSRLAMLDALANSPDVSPTTREWAQNLIDLLLG